MRIAALLLALGLVSARAEVLGGRVLEDHSGAPLASAELRVAREGVRKLVAELETDASGRFRAEGIPAGDYRIEISKPNYVSTTVRARVEGSADSLFRLVRYGVIAGKVYELTLRGVPKGCYVKDIAYGTRSIHRRPFRPGSAAGAAGVRVTLARDGGSRPGTIM